MANEQLQGLPPGAQAAFEAGRRSEAKAYRVMGIIAAWASALAGVAIVVVLVKGWPWWWLALIEAILFPFSILSWAVSRYMKRTASHHANGAANDNEGTL